MGQQWELSLQVTGPIWPDSVSEGKGICDTRAPIQVSLTSRLEFNFYIVVVVVSLCQFMEVPGVRIAGTKFPKWLAISRLAKVKHPGKSMCLCKSLYVSVYVAKRRLVVGSLWCLWLKPPDKGIISRPMNHLILSFSHSQVNSSRSG